MKSKILLVSTLMVLMISFTFCKQSKKAAKWQPPKDQLAFIEYYVTFDGKVLEGTSQPGMRIDGPTYTFDKELGEINSNLEQNFSKDTVTLIMGYGRIRRGSEGGGLSSRLIGINKLPFQEGNLVINELHSNKIICNLNDEKIELTQGIEWQKVIEKIDTIQSPDGRLIIQRQFTHQLNFHGFILKEKVNIQNN